MHCMAHAAAVRARGRGGAGCCWSTTILPPLPQSTPHEWRPMGWAGDRTRSIIVRLDMAHLHPHCCSSMRAGWCSGRCCGLGSHRCGAVRCGRLVTRPLALRDGRCAALVERLALLQRSSNAAAMSARGGGATWRGRIRAQLTNDHSECEMPPHHERRTLSTRTVADWPGSSRRCRLRCSSLLQIIL